MVSKKLVNHHSGLSVNYIKTVLQDSFYIEDRGLPQFIPRSILRGNLSKQTSFSQATSYSSIGQSHNHSFKIQRSLYVDIQAEEARFVEAC